MRISDWSSHVCSSDLAPSEASGDFLLLPIQILGGEVFALDHGQRIVANRGFRALLKFSCMFLGGIMRHYNMRLHRLELGPQGSVAAISGDAHAVHASAGARRNETANNDIILQADEWVLLALTRGSGKNAGRLCELRASETTWGMQARTYNSAKE